MKEKLKKGLMRFNANEPYDEAFNQVITYENCVSKAITPRWSLKYQ